MVSLEVLYSVYNNIMELIQVILHVYITITFSLSRSVAVVQSLSLRIRVTLGNRMDTPPAVCEVD